MSSASDLSVAYLMPLPNPGPFSQPGCLLPDSLAASSACVGGDSTSLPSRLPERPSVGRWCSWRRPHDTDVLADVNPSQTAWFRPIGMQVRTRTLTPYTLKTA